ncbi:MAG: FAD-dependent oxidoreductase, partial [Candidatus Eremiobacteraeota bacterium]|nr:FAD-dependent oxidoreductase [Candidatus Eremiobacteraeota bacterium]
MKRERYDLVVIGAGSGGFAAARTARDLDVNVALVDHGPLGGLCILRGCMPSKALIASSDAVGDIETFKELGVNAERVTVDFDYIMKRKAELIGGFADYRIEGIEEFPLYSGRAKFLTDTSVQVGDDVILEARKFIIATGSVVAPAEAVHGLVETGYIDSDGALEIPKLPKSMVVLGGGYIGCELGQFFARMGLKVTMVLRSRHLLSTEDHDLGDALTAYYRADGIEVRTESEICRVEKRDDQKAVIIKHGGIEGDVVADEILYCLGRVPNVCGMNLDEIGVPCHHITGIDVDDYLQTCNPNIYAIG